MSQEAVDLAMQPAVAEFEDAVASCREALREASELLKLQEATQAAAPA